MRLDSITSGRLVGTARSGGREHERVLVCGFGICLMVTFYITIISLCDRFAKGGGDMMNIAILLTILILQRTSFKVHAARKLTSVIKVFKVLVTKPGLSGVISPIPTFFVGMMYVLLLVVLKYRGIVVCGRSAFILKCLLLRKCSIAKRRCLCHITNLLIKVMLYVTVFCGGRGGEPCQESFLSLFHRFSVGSTEGE